MPLYQYQCVQCGNKFEELANFEDRIHCPKCGSQQTEKMVTACARFKSATARETGTSMSAGGCGSCSGGNCASCGR